MCDLAVPLPRRAVAVDLHTVTVLHEAAHLGAGMPTVQIGVGLPLHATLTGVLAIDGQLDDPHVLAADLHDLVELGDGGLVAGSGVENVTDLEGIALVGGESGNGTIGLDEEGFRVHTEESGDFL